MERSHRFPLGGINVSLFLLAFYQLALSSCALLEMKDQAETIEQAGSIRGKVVVASKRRGSVIVRRYHLEGVTFVSDTFTRATSTGAYHFYVLPGTYYIAAFIDSNQDGRYQKGEDADYFQKDTGEPAPVVVEAGKTVDVGPLSIAGLPPQLSGKYQAAYLPQKIIKNIGAVTTLDDPVFSREKAAKGMWKPLEFLEQIGGGVFFLQTYQADKIPVLFIHGIKGSPLDWEHVIHGLDKDTFQPWVAYYPSGFRMDMISDYLARSLAALQDKYHFQRIAIVAHSMGGLVARSALRKYYKRYPGLAQSVDLLITINAPLGGMKSASLGVRQSPIVVPVWRDLDPNSDFFRELNAWSLPKDVPYFLVFSYVNGSSDDTVVPLHSQIPLAIQKQVTRLYGFNETHTGILKDEMFLNLFHSLLASRSKPAGRQVRRGEN